MNYVDALAYLDAHASYETTGRIESPTLKRMQRLMEVMGDPQAACPVIHITGTNGKGSTAQIITRLLIASGLTVGTYTSPHLERINERIARNSEPIDDESFADAVAAVADLEILAGVRPTYFEICTAAAFRWFADVAVDVVVIEVGLLGRWDATNVADGEVAVVTNVGMEHNEFAGPTLADVATEKAGIVKPHSSLVLGVTDPEIAQIFAGAGADLVLQRGEQFDCVENELSLGGRLLTVRTSTTTYRQVFLPLHGRHQGDNAAIALAAVEAFFGAPLAADVVEEAFASVKMPGRFEVLGHQPLVIVDGAHNPHGADMCAQVFFEDFDPTGARTLVVGLLRGRDPQAMLEALRAEEFDRVICCAAPSPRRVPAAELAAAATAVGCADVTVVDSVAGACNLALRGAEADDAILVAGSLYVVGAAREHLRALLP
jgi:dihydrofolate synthase / folylpolyglutamate synthase